MAAEQAKKLLDDDAYLLIETLYALDKPASVDNHWILHRRDSYRSVIERLSMTQQTGDALLSEARRRLLDERAQRTPPITDKKILSGWNGLLITGLCDAFDALGNEAWLDTAQEIADFLRTQCWNGEHLSVCLQDGQTTGPAYLDDYAGVLQGLLSLQPSLAEVRRQLRQRPSGCCHHFVLRQRQWRLLLHPRRPTCADLQTQAQLR